MKNENMKNPAELSEQELSKISGGTADNFDLEKALQENEEGVARKGIQIFNESPVRFG